MTDDQTTLGAVRCPTCDAEIPIGVTTRMESGDVVITPNVADVWAHAWTHDQEDQ